jgi:hypothetical protein
MTELRLSPLLVNANASMHPFYLLKRLNISSYHFKIKVGAVN